MSKTNESKPATETATGAAASTPAAPAANRDAEEAMKLAEAAELRAREAEDRLAQLARENDRLRSQLDAGAPVGAHGGPRRGFGGRMPWRARTGLGIVIAGERRDIAAGETFEASEEECAGLKPGEHFELARDDE